MEIALSVIGVIIGLVAWLYPRNPSSPEPVTSPTEPQRKPPSGLQVQVSYGFLTYDSPARMGDHQMLFIQAVNPISRRFRVEGVGILIEGTGNQLAWIQVDSAPFLPCVLGETEHIRFWKELHYIGQSLLDSGFDKPVRLRAFVRDSYDARHFSEPFDCDPVDWAKKTES